MTTERTKWTVGRRQLSWSRVLLGVGVLSGGLLMGGLVPGMLLAGTLDPTPEAVDGGGDPASTGATYPAWDKILLANDGVDSCHSSRFTCVMGDEAVRDNETGLVYERSPSITGGEFDDGLRVWTNQKIQCNVRTVGGRRGWRMPGVHELASLLDPGNGGGNHLPVGHPFSDVQSERYWSATSFADSPTPVYVVDFGVGVVGIAFKMTNSHLVWCVRGRGPLTVY